MRLIDADKLIDYFYFGIYDKPIIDGISDRKIIDIIKNHPTAYSVDKVVEEFDKKYNNSLWIKGNEEFSITRNELIEIVNHGGVGTETETIRDKAVKWNNNSSKRVPYEFIDYVEGKREICESYDVCEWYKVKNGNAYKCHTHAEIHDSRVLDWCVCPYCGKKIKVVE